MTNYFEHMFILLLSHVVWVHLRVCLCVPLHVCLCVCVSLSTILKISKNAGVLLKPHVSLLVVSLLESVTTLEPQMMNYLSLHAAANQAAADKVSSHFNGRFLQVQRRCR